MLVQVNQVNCKYLFILDFFSGVVHKLIPALEKHRNAELAERKEKHKKQQAAEKEAAEKNKESKSSTSTNDTENTLFPFAGEMEVTVQEEEDRPPPPQEEQPPQQPTDTVQAATLSAATEIAESLVDSVLGASTAEASRIQRK